MIVNTSLIARLLPWKLQYAYHNAPDWLATDVGIFQLTGRPAAMQPVAKLLLSLCYTVIPGRSGTDAVRCWQMTQASTRPRPLQP